MRTVAAYEGVAPEWVRDGLAKGVIAIPKNRKRSFERLRGIGRGLSTKINANLGASPHHSRLEEELEKLDAAVKYGADATTP